MKRIKVLILLFLICLFLGSCSLFSKTETPTPPKVTPTEPIVEVTPTPVITPTPTPEVTLSEIYVKNHDEIYVNVGDKYKPNLIIMAKFSDGTEKDVSEDVAFSTISTTNKGVQELTIIYQSLSIKVPVNVVKQTGITLDTSKAKVLYKVGDTIDLSGLFVYKTYEDDLVLDADNYIIQIIDENGDELSFVQPLNLLGKYTINIFIGSYTKSYEIDVVEEIIDEPTQEQSSYTYLELDTSNVKTEFIDEEFNYDNLVLNAVKSNNTKEVIPSNDYIVTLYKGDYYMSKFDGQGEYTVNVRYKGDIPFEQKTFTYKVNYLRQNYKLKFGYSGAPFEEFEFEITPDSDPKDFITVPDGYFFTGFSVPFDEWPYVESTIKIYVEEIENSNKRYISFVDEGYKGYYNYISNDVRSVVLRNEIEVECDQDIIPEGMSFLYWDIPYRFVINENMIATPVFGPDSINLANFNVTEEETVNNVSANAIDINVKQFLESTPEGFSLDSITLGIEGEIVAEIPYTEGMVSAYFTELTANTNYEVGAYYSQNQAQDAALRKARQLTYRFHFVGFVVVSEGPVTYRVRFMYNGDCFYRWYYKSGNVFENETKNFTITLPEEYSTGAYAGYTCVGSKDIVGKVTSDIDIEAELVPPAGDNCYIIFYDRYYPNLKNVLKVVEVPKGGTVNSNDYPSVEQEYFDEDHKYTFSHWSGLSGNITSNLIVSPFYNSTTYKNYDAEITVIVADTYLFIYGELLNAPSNVWTNYQYKLYEVSNGNLIAQSNFTELHITNKRMETGLKPNTAYKIECVPKQYSSTTINIINPIIEFTTRKGTEKTGYSFTTSSTSTSYSLGPVYADIRTFVEYTKDSSGNAVNHNISSPYGTGNIKKQNTTYYLNPIKSVYGIDGLYYVYFDNISVKTKSSTEPSFGTVTFEKVTNGYSLYGKINDPSEIVKGVYLVYTTTDNSTPVEITTYYSNSGSNSTFKYDLDLSVNPNYGTGEYYLANAYIVCIYIYDGQQKTISKNLSI